MLTTNIIYRVFKLKYGESIGTAFTIDYEDKQYLVTARHVVEGISESDRVDVYFKEKWNFMDVRLVGVGSGNIDIAVLTAPLMLSRPLLLEPTTAGVYLGQDMHFLGFPYGIHAISEGLTPEFSFPLVKKGCLSAAYFGEDSDLLIDGHNNPGFSGGPVIFGNPMEVPPVYKVAGVISGYRYEWEPIYKEGKETDLQYQYNTGIIIAHDIKHVLALIKSNPIGFDLSGYSE